MTQSVNLNVKGIVYETGTTEILVVTNRQWAARIRNKKFKQSIISQSNLATLTIKIKTK